MINQMKLSKNVLNHNILNIHEMKGNDFILYAALSYCKYAALSY